MVGTCANPACSEPFHNLRSGKLFLVETPVDTDPAQEQSRTDFAPIPRRVQYFWLCESCAQTMRLVYDQRTGVGVEPLSLPGDAVRRAAVGQHEKP
jgi:hypothetical protein